MIVSDFGKAITPPDQPLSKLNSNPKESSAETLKTPIDCETVDTDGSNIDLGSSTGIDLLDIDKIKTEGYVKDYLKILKENEEGKVDSRSKYTLDVLTLLGIIMAENGPYDESGGTLPSSVLPWDAGEVAPYSKDSVSLYNYTSKTKDRIGIYYKAEKVDPAKNGVYYVSPMQITYSYFSDPGFHSSNYSGEGHEKSKSRKPDPYYFPDQITILNTLASSGFSIVNYDELDRVERAILASCELSAGPAVWPFQQGGLPKGSPRDKGQLTKAIKDLSGFFKKGYKKHETILSSKNIPHNEYKWYATLMLLEQGWMLGKDTNLLEGGAKHQTAIEYMSSNSNLPLVHRIWNEMGNKGSKEDCRKYLQSKVGNPTKKNGSNKELYPFSAGFGVLYYEKGETMLYHTIETTGHNLAVAFAGQGLYERMMKVAGSDGAFIKDDEEDKTTNSGKDEEEEKPRKEEPNDNSSIVIPQKYKDNGVTKDNISPISLKLLDEATQHEGKDYDYGGAGENGRSYDCSGLTMSTYKRAIGVSIPRVASDQQTTDIFETIDIEDAKVGDLLFYDSQLHVAIFTGIISKSDTEKGVYQIGYFHSPKPGGKIEYSQNDFGPPGTGDQYRYTTVRRLKKDLYDSAVEKYGNKNIVNDTTTESTTNVDECKPMGDEITSIDNTKVPVYDTRETRLNNPLKEDKTGAEAKVNFRNLGRAPDPANPTDNEKKVYDIASKQKFNLPADYPGYCSPYGMRKHPITGQYKIHAGVDIGLPLGKNVIATKSGVIAESVHSNTGWGNRITIYHGNGEYSLYGHNSELVAKVGDFVNRGDVIAKVGSTGMSTGPHIHLEVWQGGFGKHTDPMKYVFDLYDKNNPPAGKPSSY